MNEGLLNSLLFNKKKYDAMFVTANTIFEKNRAVLINNPYVQIGATDITNSEFKFRFFGLAFQAGLEIDRKLETGYIVVYLLTKNLEQRFTLKEIGRISIDRFGNTTPYNEKFYHILDMLTQYDFSKLEINLPLTDEGFLAPSIKIA